MRFEDIKKVGIVGGGQMGGLDDGLDFENGKRLGLLAEGRKEDDEAEKVDENSSHGQFLG